MTNDIIILKIPCFITIDFSGLSLNTPSIVVYLVISVSEKYFWPVLDLILSLLKNIQIVAASIGLRNENEEDNAIAAAPDADTVG
jgi:hypothetical protein